MINILVDDIVPIIVIMALGYICGKFSYFDRLYGAMVHRLLGASVVFWRQRGLPAVRGLHVSDSSQLVPAEKALVCREKTG